MHYECNGYSDENYDIGRLFFEKHSLWSYTRNGAGECIESNHDFLLYFPASETTEEAVGILGYPSSCSYGSRERFDDVTYPLNINDLRSICTCYDLKTFKTLAEQKADPYLEKVFGSYQSLDLTGYGSLITLNMYKTYLEGINDPFPKENKERFKRLNLYELGIGDSKLVTRPRYYETAENKMIIFGYCWLLRSFGIEVAKTLPTNSLCIMCIDVLKSRYVAYATSGVNIGDNSMFAEAKPIAYS